MILSASRRTDIPALYVPWLLARLAAGYCLVPNPFNARQVARISLAPAEVDAIVFWTRHARPLLAALPVLERLGLRHVVQYTITGYDRRLERRTPPVDAAIAAFVELARRRPPGAVVWRYDPILLGPAFPLREHHARFERIARGLQGHAHEVIVSVVDLYKKTERRLGAVLRWDEEVARSPLASPELAEVLGALAEVARAHGMALSACAEDRDFAAMGIARAKCVDDRLLARLFGGAFPSRKDPGQRPACACVVSKDIGVPDTCTLGCVYCYATRSDELARRRRREHQPGAPCLWPPSPGV